MKKWISLFIPAILASSAALFAQEAPEAVPEQGSYMQTLIMIAIAIMFFYFILWRPEQKRRKAMEKQRSGLKKGDRVTAMGIVGTIVRVQPDSPTIILKMYDGAKIEMLKAAISEVHPATEEEAIRAEKEDANETKKIESVNSKE